MFWANLGELFRSGKVFKPDEGLAEEVEDDAAVVVMDERSGGSWKDSTTAGKEKGVQLNLDGSCDRFTNLSNVQFGFARSSNKSGLVAANSL